jgi:TATA-binding protein-associated factor
MAQQQSSRLHRLLTLLDTGSTQATRFTAARQIGDIAKLHPQDLNSLLSKVSPYLHCKNWDTRVAAAHAIGAIAESVKHTSINDIRTCVEVKMAEAGISGGPVQDLVVCCPDFLPKTVSSTSFRSFDLNKVLDFGALLASGGQEYDIANDNSKNPKERLSRQKQNLRRRLGLDVCEQFMDMSDMIRDEDLMVQKHNSSTGNGISPSHPQFYTASRPAGHNNVHQLVANMVPNFKSRRPSARELNLLKRKSKINSKDQTKGASSKDIEPDVSSDMAASPRGFCPDLSNSSNKLLTDAAVIDEASFEDEGDEVWPFHSFVEQLILDMFDPAWEVRHGSVMALREILTHQGARAEVFMPNPQNPEPKDNHIKTTLKREREIDLNIQEVLPEQDPEQILKKPKLEDSSAPPLLDLCKSETNSSIKLEDNKLNLCFETNDSMGVLCEDKLSTESLKNLPENSELMNFLKLARQSWLKNSEFLQDCATRFLCVLSLDRFGDYVSDQVVAPVRETCAQALGAVIKYMHPTLVHQTLNILLQMQVNFTVDQSGKFGMVAFWVSNIWLLCGRICFTSYLVV